MNCNYCLLFSFSENELMIRMVKDIYANEKYLMNLLQCNTDDSDDEESDTEDNEDDDNSDNSEEEDEQGNSRRSKKQQQSQQQQQSITNYIDYLYTSRYLYNTSTSNNSVLKGLIKDNNSRTIGNTDSNSKDYLTNYIVDTYCSNYDDNDSSDSDSEYSDYHSNDSEMFTSNGSLKYSIIPLFHERVVNSNLSELLLPTANTNTGNSNNPSGINSGILKLVLEEEQEPESVVDTSTSNENDGNNILQEFTSNEFSSSSNEFGIADQQHDLLDMRHNHNKQQKQSKSKSSTKSNADSTSNDKDTTIKISPMLLLGNTNWSIIQSTEGLCIPKLGSKIVTNSYSGSNGSNIKSSAYIVPTVTKINADKNKNNKTKSDTKLLVDNSKKTSKKSSKKNCKKNKKQQPTPYQMYKQQQQYCFKAMKQALVKLIVENNLYWLNNGSAKYPCIVKQFFTNNSNNNVSIKSNKSSVVNDSIDYQSSSCYSYSYSFKCKPLSPAYDYLLNKCISNNSNNEKYNRQCTMEIPLVSGTILGTVSSLVVSLTTSNKKSTSGSSPLSPIHSVMKFPDHPTLDLFTARVLDKSPQFAITQDYYLLYNFDCIFRLKCDSSAADADFDDLLLAETVANPWEPAEDIECPFQK